MADYAPVYMTTYDEDGPQVTLVDVTIDTDEFEEGAAAGTLIGTLAGYDDRSVLTLADDAGGKVALEDNELVVGSVASTDGTLTVQVREDSQYAMGAPRITTLTITVTPAA